ncbi:hypothetical protein CGLO_18071 [Colletotrichum gloeosporioides Cg-14]|uniref:Uncharacterized protein n=1 Tax=Colletotrichum gloeosporioides (strain Cg-14) TaxID=1237896 RepID=T0JIQ3_COLGC|nr:hypothetical protein CGLO_18071 [Colletotrichum gloeosporioides Cg-14]
MNHVLYLINRMMLHDNTFYWHRQQINFAMREILG